MSNSTTSRCTNCGARVAKGATALACPACLLSGALADESVDGTRPRATGESLELPCRFGEYRLIAELGSGGMGTVYEAEQSSTGRRLALKLLDQQLTTPDVRQRFLREGRLAASINHPNSLYVFGSEEIDGVPVISMEIAPGGTLHDRLDKQGPLPVTEAVDAMLDVVAGLEAADTAGVLHRDIKPSNCFVGPDGTVKIGDFGLSVSTLPHDDSYATASGVVMGTPAFAAPEQLRGDELDRRADIYSVGATLYTLLTGRAPFEGDNVVQVVANAIAVVPESVNTLREGVPPGLTRVVTRCLAKEPDARYADYTELRDALLPFGSKEPAPASILIRLSAGWIDYLIAFLPAYLVLMLVVGAEQLIVAPLVERTLYATRYHVMLLAIGVLYFTLSEGILGAGLGKRLKGLRVVRTSGRRPGLARAMVRILLPILCVEVVRWPLTLALISTPDWTGLQTAGFVIAAMAGGCVPAVLAFQAHRKTGFATAWDLVSGTRVVVRPKGAVRPSISAVPTAAEPRATEESLGPFDIVDQVEPGSWMRAYDPVLRRRIWLVRRGTAALSRARRDVSRPGRLRWLQTVDTGEGSWDAFEAPAGTPFAELTQSKQHVPWSALRHWLHDLASEMWAAQRDGTLPAEASLDQVWITSDGRAVLLDRPWPCAPAQAERIAIGDIAGQQRFLAAFAGAVTGPDFPIHARRTLRNLEAGRFDKLGFLAGTLRGMLERPTEVTRAIRAASMFLLPLYVWIAFVIGRYHDKPWDDAGGIIVHSAALILTGFALFHLLTIPVGSTAGQAIFRLAVVDADGEPAAPSRLLARWAVAWLPLLLPLWTIVLAAPRLDGLYLGGSLAVIAAWICGAGYAAMHPHRGIHDRLTGTWVVRR